MSKYENGWILSPHHSDGDSDETSQAGSFLTLATVEIVYYLPDFPSLVQRFVVQNVDRAPEFPKLHRFLAFWRRKIDATLCSIAVSHLPLEQRQAHLRAAAETQLLH